MRILNCLILSFVFINVSARPPSKTVTKRPRDSICNGAFDVYFVLDLSSSLISGGRNHFKEDTVSFVRQLVDKFTSPLLRLSFITFNTYATVVMSLTNDRSVVESKLDELRYAIPDGRTELGLGLEKVNGQIVNYGQKRSSVVVILTDGMLEHKTKVKAVDEANKARQMGSTIMAVGVGDFDKSQLLEIAGGSKQLIFTAKSFHGLNAIVKRVIDGSCVEISSANPDVVCSNSSFELSVTGKGFNKSGDLNHVKCNYFFNKTSSFLVTPTFASPNRLICPSPNNLRLSPGDEVTLQVTLNGGISFISSNVTIKSVFCVSSSGVVWTLFLLLATLLLALIWWFWNAICCVVAINSKPKPSRPMPPPPPIPPSKVTELQQWPSVDASFYGGRGAGGMHPMRVRWGDRGCTEGAMHLEKTKDAKEVGFVTKEVLVDREFAQKAPVAQQTFCCCCGLMKVVSAPFAAIASLYKQVSVRRPNANDVGNCVMMKKEVDVSNEKRCSGASLTGGYLDTGI